MAWPLFAPGLTQFFSLRRGIAGPLVFRPVLPIRMAGTHVPGIVGLQSTARERINGLSGPLSRNPRIPDLWNTVLFAFAHLSWSERRPGGLESHCRGGVGVAWGGDDSTCQEGQSIL